MEFYQLEYFRVLCKYGNYTQASRELNVSQPTVSMTVKKLENELNCNLIDHNSKSFALSKKGEILFKWAVTLHNDMEGLRMELDAVTVKEREVVRLALPIPLCLDILHNLDHESFFDRGISLYLQQSGHTSIVSNLLNGSVDVGIISKDFLVPSLDYYDFSKVEYWVCFSPEHKFNGAEFITSEMLRGETIVIPRTKNTISKSILEHSIKYDFQDQLQYVDTIPENIGNYAAHSNSIAFMPKLSCKGCCAPLSPPYYCQLVVAWCRDRPLTKETRKLIMCLKELADK